MRLAYHAAEDNLFHSVPVPPKSSYPWETSEMDGKEVPPFCAWEWNFGYFASASEKKNRHQMTEQRVTC